MAHGILLFFPKGTGSSLPYPSRKEIATSGCHIPFIGATRSSLLLHSRPLLPFRRSSALSPSLLRFVNFRGLLLPLTFSLFFPVWPCPCPWAWPWHPRRAKRRVTRLTFLSCWRKAWLRPLTPGLGHSRTSAFLSSKKTYLHTDRSRGQLLSGLFVYCLSFLQIGHVVSSRWCHYSSRVTLREYYHQWAAVKYR